ncbi:MAG TPA: GAF domain-containing protein, partial [Nitriliruptorales bacterium]|nr:GAF domain-containing protein [Nitriliruptorales bacterium]
MTVGGDPRRRALRRYVASVVVAGVVAVVVSYLVHPARPSDALPGLALGLAALVGTWIPLRFHYRGGLFSGFTLEEAVLVAMLFTLPAGLPPALLLVAAVIGYGTKQRELIKIGFNVGQVSLWSAAATATFHVVGADADILAPRSLLALVAATVTLNVVNACLIAELFRRLDGRPWRDTFREVGRLYAVTWIGNTSFGLLLAYVARQDPLATIPASVLMVGLYLGYRGYAHVLEERRRSQRLHAVTRNLATATGSANAGQAFLRDLAQLFGAEVAELAIRQHDRLRLIRHGHGGLWVRDDVEVLSEPLRRALQDADLVRVEQGSRRVEREGSAHRDALAAPLVFEGMTIGALAVHGRVGLEPWTSSDLQLLGTLASEAAVAVKNVELVTSLQDQTRKLRDIVEAVADGIVMVDAAGRIAAWNPAMERAVGRVAADALQRPWEQVLHQEHPSWDRFDAAMQDVLAGQR